jgi:hypothetical protein
MTFCDVGEKLKLDTPDWATENNGSDLIVRRRLEYQNEVWHFIWLSKAWRAERNVHMILVLLSRTTLICLFYISSSYLIFAVEGSLLFLTMCFSRTSPFTVCKPTNKSFLECLYIRKDDQICGVSWRHRNLKNNVRQSAIWLCQWTFLPPLITKISI